MTFGAFMLVMGGVFVGFGFGFVAGRDDREGHRMNAHGTNKMQVGRVKSRSIGAPWWASCPVCPIKTGLAFRHTHTLAFDWAWRHIQEEHKSTPVAIEWPKNG